MNFMTADVKIKVDDSKLPAQLAKAKSAVTKTVTAIKNSFSKMATSFKAAFDKMVRIAKWGALAIAGALTLATRAAMKQQDAVFLLTAALKIAGEWTQVIENRFRAFAASIQQVTIYGDEEVLALMQLQKSLGVTADKLEEAAKQAIGLATATGRDIRSMAMYIALAQQGEFTMLRRYIPALRATTDETEQLEIITKVCAEGFKLAEERAKTASGGLRQMWNALGDVAEKIGGALLPAITDSASKIKQWAKDNEDRIGRWAEIWVDKIGIVINKLWDWVNILTTEPKKAMGILKDELIIFFTALVDTFMIAGIAAGKAFWRGIGFGKPSTAEIVARRREELGGGPLLWEEGTRQRIQRELMLENLKKEIGIVERLKEAWKGVGTEMSKAVPTPEGWRGTEAPPTFDPYAVDEAYRLSQTIGAGGRSIFEDNMAAVDVGTEHIKRNLDERKQYYDDYYNAQLWAEERQLAAEIAAAEEVERRTKEIQAAGVLRKMRIAEEYAMTMARSWTTAIDQMMFEGKKFGETMIDMFRSLAREIANIMLYKKFAEPIAYALMGVPLPGSVEAPSAQHGGTIERTGWAKVHKGETYSGVGSNYGRSIININNTVSDRVGVEVEEYMYDDQRILDVTMRAAANDGTFRQSMKSI